MLLKILQLSTVILIAMHRPFLFIDKQTKPKENADMMNK